MEIVDNVLFRKIFIKFIQIIHPFEVKFESLILLRRYILCQKIIQNNEIIKFEEIYNKLLALCSNSIWEQRIENLVNQSESSISFVNMFEKLKWETIMELICNNDYKAFLIAIKKKSPIIREIIKNSYELYYY